MKHYNIFISYRRDGGAQYARTLQLILESRGYRTFLDYDELTDGVFKPEIEEGIKTSDVYIIILSPHALDRCVNEDDWVRREIELAAKLNKQIIPVNPDGLFKELPAQLPEHLAAIIGQRQYSEIFFGQNLRPTVGVMIKNRIRPYTRRHIRWLAPTLIAVAVIIAAIVGVKRYHNAEIERLKEEITFGGEQIDWAPDITKTQLLAVGEIVGQMVDIQGGEFVQGPVADENGEYDETVDPDIEVPPFAVKLPGFKIGKFEVTVGQWNAIMDDTRKGDPAMPVADVTYAACDSFINRLNDLTVLNFRLPTESEWEYAARGGMAHDTYRYAGSDGPEACAWFKANSRGVAHSDLPVEPTADDLFNMSGNVSEWTSTDFVPYNGDDTLADIKSKVIRGGNYESEDYEITVWHRDMLSPDEKSPTVGLRLAI